MIHWLRPLGIAFLCFLAGLLLSLRFAPSPRPFLLAAPALLASVALLLPSRGRAPGARVAAADAALLLAFVAAGAALGAWGAAAARGDCRARLPDGARVRVQGVLGGGFRPAPLEQRAPLLPLARTTVLLPGTGWACRAPELRVRLAAGASALAGGSRVELAGEWVGAGGGLVHSPWPQDPAYRGFVAVDSLLTTVPPAPARHPLLWLRGRTEAALWRLFPGQGPLVEALVLGRRERLDPELRERFARSGLVHLLAISGSHVALFAGMLLTLGAAARLSRERVAWLCIFATAVYLAVIGAPASAVRAGVMLALGLLTRVLQRPSAMLPVVAAAALVILAWEPRAVLDAGFQLSFAGVLGIAWLGRPALAKLPRRVRPAPRWLAESLAVSAAAFAATAPIVAHHFGQVAPVAILANLPAVPLTALALAGIMGSLLVEPLAPPLARVVAGGAGAALWALDRVAETAAQWPLGHLGVARPSWPAWAAAVLALAVAGRVGERLRPGARWVAAGGACAAVLLAWPLLASRGAGGLEVHFLDVGQGDAVAIRTPAGRWLLVDAGPAGRDYDAGERRVVPFLRAHGARRLEVMLLTHPDADHIGGAAAVLRALPVGRVVEPGLGVGKGLYLELLREIEARGVAWSAARAGQSLRLDDITLELLWPTPDALDRPVEANQISTVVRLRYGDFALLLTGDVSDEVERILVERAPEQLRAQVLKAGHHGSATSTSAELLRAVRPELVVISAGRRNRYGHPAPAVLDRIRGHGIEIARTDRDGTVTLRVGSGPGAQWSREER